MTPRKNVGLILYFTLLWIVCFSLKAWSQEVDSIYQRAQGFRDNNQLDSALVAYDEAILLYEQTEDWSGYVKASTGKHLVQFDMLDFEQSREGLERILAEARDKIPGQHLTHAYILDALGKVEIRFSHFQQAVVYLRESAGLHLEYGSRNRALATTYSQLGESYRRINQLDSASYFLERAKSIFETLDTSPSTDLAKVLTRQADIQSKYGQMDSALQLYLLADSIITINEGEHSNDRAASINQLAIFYANSGQYIKSHKYFSILKEIDEANLQPGDPNLATTYSNLGIIYEIMGDAKNAETYHAKALKIKTEALGTENPQLYYDFLGLAILYIQLGDYDQSLLFLEQSQRILETHGLRNAESDSKYYSQKGSIYKIKGKIQEAKEHYTSAVESLQTLPNKAAISGPIYHNIATMYLDIGEIDSAISYSNLALENNSVLSAENIYVLENLHFLGNLYNAIGELDKSERQFDQALQMADKLFGKTHRERAFILADYAKLLLNKKDHRRALKIAQQGLIGATFEFTDTLTTKNPRSDDTPNPRALAMALTAKSEILRDQYLINKDTLFLSQALATSTLAIAALEAAQSNYKSEGSVLILRQQFNQIFQQAVENAHTLYELTNEDQYLEQALSFADKSKSILLSAFISDSRAKSFSNIPDQLLKKEADLKREISFYEQKLLDTNKDSDPESYRTIQTSLFDQKIQHDSLIDHYEKNYPGYYDLKYNTEKLYLSEIKKSLDKDQHFIEYYLSGDLMYIFCVSRSTTSIHTVAIDSTFQNNIIHLSTLLKNKKTDNKTFIKTSYALFQHLIGPVSKEIKGRDLIIAPHGILGTIPFEILVNSPEEKSFKSMEYLVKNHAISYTFNISLFINLQKKRKSSRESEFVAYAPSFVLRDSEGSAVEPTLLANITERSGLAPLHGAKAEIDILNALYNGTVFKNEFATESNFKNKTSGKNIVHLATHAIIDEINPLNSRLLFTIDPDSDEDGDLHAWELYNLDLNADVVVLSACNTGAGSIEEGEGVLSLGRAFAYTNCPTQIMSLWPAQDLATAQIMETFYKHSRDEDLSRAMRRAKLEFLEQSTDLDMHPFYWAGFIVQGNTSIKSGSSSMAFMWTGILMLIAMVWWILKKALYD